MPVRVELRPEAIDDLVGYATSGNLPLFLKKLLRLEAVGKDAGLPLGRGLTGWRKIVVGDRNWRIIFAMNTAESVATIWVIGDRDDDACYKEAQRRVETPWPKPARSRQLGSRHVPTQRIATRGEKTAAHTHPRSSHGAIHYRTQTRLTPHH